MYFFYSYKSAENCLRNMSGVDVSNVNGRIFVAAEPTARTEHIKKLVVGQKKSGYEFRSVFIHTSIAH